MKFKPEDPVIVTRTKQAHKVVEAHDGISEGKAAPYYKLDNGTHYWENELAEPKT